MDYQTVYNLLSHVVQAELNNITAAQPSLSLPSDTVPLEPPVTNPPVVNQSREDSVLSMSSDSTVPARRGRRDSHSTLPRRRQRRDIVVSVAIPTNNYPDINFVERFLRNAASFIRDVERKTNTVIDVAGRGRNGSRSDEPTHCRVSAFNLQDALSAELCINQEIDRLICNQHMQESFKRIRLLESEITKLTPLKRKFEDLDVLLDGTSEQMEVVQKVVKRLCSDVEVFKGDAQEIKDSIVSTSEQIGVIKNGDLHHIEELRESVRELQAENARLKESYRADIERLEARLETVAKIQPSKITVANSDVEDKDDRDTSTMVLHTNIIKAMYKVPVHLNWTDIRIRPDNKATLIKSMIQGVKFPIDRSKTTMTSDGTCIFKKYIPEYVQSLYEICSVGYIKYDGSWIRLEADLDVCNQL